MLRPTYTNQKKDLIIQLNDWVENDSVINDDSSSSNESDENDNNHEKWFKEKEYVIRSYGITEEGNSISIDIKGFTPFFYLKVPDNWTKKTVNKFGVKLRERVNKYTSPSLIDIKIVKKIPFYGFCNYEKCFFMKLTFKNIMGFYSYRKIIKETANNPIEIYGDKYDFDKLQYETNITPMLRFFHIKNIKPVGWIKLPYGKYKINYEKTTYCQINCTINFNDIEKIDLNKIGKFVIASYDIECTSEDGSFPKENKPGDEIIQIGTTINIFGSDEIHKYIATLKKCNQIEGATVEEFENEKDLLIGWCKFIRKLDPDIITGYNIWGFDWKYIYNRAFNGSCGKFKPYHETLFNILSRTISNDPSQTSTVKYIEKELQSAALGQNKMYYLEIQGVIQVDLYKYIQKEYKLDSYKLNVVSQLFIGLEKDDLTPNQLFENYRKGTVECITEIAEYCIQDCALCNKLLNKLQVVPNNIAMGNVCSIPFSYLFLRGQGIKLFSLVIKFCAKEDFLIKILQPEDIDQNSYEGAIVFVPTPGLYLEPVAVMDYASLYPSSMISENISHDSCVGFKEYYIIKDATKTEQAVYELRKNTIIEKYDNLPDYNYVDIEYDIFKGVDKDKKKIGYKVCRFAEKKNGEKSILPRIEMDLLKARKDTRAKAGYKHGISKDGKEYIGLLKKTDETYIFKKIDEIEEIVNISDIIELKDYYSDFQKSLLDSEQLAIKITCNSLYGQVGASTSAICFKELAASTTATGRKMVTCARDYTLEKFKGSKLVYGDTDSIFVNFTDYIKQKYINDYPDGKISDRELLKLSIETGMEASKYVTSKLKHPQDLTYEKTFYPFMIFSKKRYYGYKYEKCPDKYKETSMGIVLKRRDNAPIVKEIYEGVLNYLMNKKDINGSYEYFKEIIKDLLNGKVEINKLIISKSLKSDYANPTTIPHKVLADRMGERDPGNKPQSNDRLQYCFIDTCNLKCKKCGTEVDKENCKCISCMDLYCKVCLINHSTLCKNICRFCKMSEYKLTTGKMSITKCSTCTGYYCAFCFPKHKKRTDKYGVEHTDKCKKVLSTKLIQGDIVEEPNYIIKHNLLIDYMYYLERQIENPIYQIFELFRKDPQKIIEDLKRNYTNKHLKKKTITDFFKYGVKKS